MKEKELLYRVLAYNCHRMTLISCLLWMISREPIFYTTNEESLGFFYTMQKAINKQARLVTYCPPTYPLKPQKYDGLMYCLKIPFEIAKNKNEWLQSIAQNGSIKEFKKRFISNFKHDNDEYEERILTINQEILGIDWIRKK